MAVFAASYYGPGNDGLMPGQQRDWDKHDPWWCTLEGVTALSSTYVCTAVMIEAPINPQAEAVYAQAPYPEVRQHSAFWYWPVCGPRTPMRQNAGGAGSGNNHNMQAFSFGDQRPADGTWEQWWGQSSPTALLGLAIMSPFERWMVYEQRSPSTGEEMLEHLNVRPITGRLGALRARYGSLKLYRHPKLAIIDLHLTGPDGLVIVRADGRDTWKRILRAYEGEGVAELNPPSNSLEPWMDIDEGAFGPSIEVPELTREAESLRRGASTSR